MPLSRMNWRSQCAAKKVEALRVLQLLWTDAGQSERFLQQIPLDWMYQFSASDVIKTSFSRQQMNFTAAFLESIARGQTRSATFMTFHLQNNSLQRKKLDRFAEVHGY
jgi:hypothetical protein